MKKNNINLTKQNNFLNKKIIDVVLIGGGIMSSTLGTYINELEPNWSINMYERLDYVAQESSNEWNNAGTGHSAFCEMNYTTLTKLNTIDISKAILINESFEISKQFWSYLIKKKILNEPKTFIRKIPHMSFVWGENNIKFLKKRFNALKTNYLFKDMIYSEDPKQIYKWAPLVMNGRDIFQKVASTYMDKGTDINFGEITRQLIKSLKKKPFFNLYLKHDVFNINRNQDNTWNISVIDKSNNCKKLFFVNAHNIFIGAGGASLTLLQKTKIPEVKGYAGFPVGGKFLISKNTSIVKKHKTKVYGMASIGTPPMSMPHIDTRILNGNNVLSFGPFATVSSKFLKYGSWIDLFNSIKFDNIFPILSVGIKNLSLIKYLINQLIMSQNNRLNILKNYYPKANIKDWFLIEAGQRVQIIKKTNKFNGILQFGTEVVTSNDGTISALLGASPGASTSASIMLDVLKSMFKNKITNNKWKEKIKKIIPSYGIRINNNLTLINYIQNYTSKKLELNNN